MVAAGGSFLISVPVSETIERIGLNLRLVSIIYGTAERNEQNYFERYESDSIFGMYSVSI